MKVSELAMHKGLHSMDEEGKIKVVILHKPEMSNIWIYLYLEDFLMERYDEHNLAIPVLASFKNYESYCKYVASPEFNSIFSIAGFKY